MLILSSIILFLGVIIARHSTLSDIISEETFTSTVTIESVDYMPDKIFTPLITSKKVLVPVTYTLPGKYSTTINCNGLSFKNNNRSIYNKCKNFLNKDVICELKMTTYNDGISLEIKNIIGIK